MGLLAGTARLEITPDPGVELMGYGARTGRATGVHDPLFARALALHQEGEERGRAIVVAADLCLITPEQAAGVRARIAARTGLTPAEILVSCTHTHSGPDTGLAAYMTGREEPSYVGPMLDSLVSAGATAWESLAPARGRWLTTSARIGRNRRLEDGPVDPSVLVLELRSPGGDTRAVLYHYACHGTVLGHDNLEISADWPGVASARIDEATGGMALFLLGAHADIDPRTRGLMDLAIEGQSRGLGFDAVEVLGGEVAEAVIGAIRSNGGPAPTDALPVRAASRSLPLAIHLGDRSEEEATKDLEARRDELASWLGIAPEAFPRLSELPNAVSERARGLPPSEARDWIARSRTYLRDRTGPHWVGGAREAEVEAQLLTVGEAALLALPLEPTTAVGLGWKRRAVRHVALAGVVGIGNGWIRYLPHPDDWAEPLSHHRYEILMSLLAPPACERLLDLGEALLRETLGA